MSWSSSSIPFIIFGIIIFVGNVLVLYLYFTKRALRTITNKFVVSLAFCDILVALLFIPFYAALDDLIKENIGIPLSGYVTSFTGFGSLFSLGALTYERYVSIFNGLRYFALMNDKKVRFMMILIWTSTLFLTLTPLPWKLSMKDNDYVTFSRAYGGCLTGIIILMNFIVFAVYFKIFLVNRKHIYKSRKDSIRLRFTFTKAESPPEQQSIINMREGTSEKHLSKTKSKIRLRSSSMILMELRAAKAIFLVVFVNCLCWLPIIAINICDLSSESGFATYLPEDFIVSSQYFFVLNSLVNPFIYAFCKQDFRNAIRKCLKRRR